MSLMDLARDFRAKNLAETLKENGICDYLNSYPGSSFEALLEHFCFIEDVFERILNAGCYLGIIEKRGNHFFLLDFNQPQVEISSAIFKLNQYIIKRGYPQESIDKGYFSIDQLEALSLNNILEYRSTGLHLSYRYLYHFDLSDPRNNVSRLLFYEKILLKVYQVDNLNNILRTGLNPWQTHFGNASGDPFHFYCETPGLLKDLLRTLHRANDESNNILLGEFKKTVPHASSLLDIGGSCGNFTLNMLKHYDLDKAHIYEKREGKETIEELITIMEPFFPKEKITYIWGDFLAQEMDSLSEVSDQKYDLISMGFILHDWKDETCISLLKKSVKHLNDSGYIILLEWVLNDEKDNHITLQDIDMLLETQGRERTANEFAVLLNEAGLALEIIISNPGTRSLIAAKKI